ncbi:MAG: bifunctional phosphoribosylaminoimidazolecarboxamide formyltransferase/IMP cyclohydrolase [Planctomycetes bacterium]|nr:bifunctional phosphoribosylaminoimidazolecarboxamide formyltransferase/IMP cyclohydrolase [Planctomycetota bacterium]
MVGSFPRRALISVSDKTGLAELAKGLNELEFEIVSTGGTRAFLQQQGAKVIDIAEYTGFPEIMDGRVKTLHPKVHGAILGRPDVPHHAEAIAAHGIIPFELVVVNLYPFEATIAKPDCTTEHAIENIDIGGPSMVRSAAKNHEHVGIVTCPSQYERVLTELRGGKLSHEFKRELAAAAFACTARYDRAIADYMAGMVGKLVQEEVPEGVTVDAARFPRVLHLDFERRMPLRYGENPHQAAAFFVEKHAEAATLAAFEKLHGKELSYNNLLDLDSALAIVREFEQPAAVVIKHNNPCGCAISESLSSAFEKAYAGDPVSAFGGIFGLNRVVDLATAEQFCIPDRFVEAIIAPGFTDEAFQLLTTKPKWKNNVRLLRVSGWLSSTSATTGSMDYRRVSGGLLAQTRDDIADPESEWKVVTNRQPTDVELRDLRFAWRLCKHVKSNAIVFAKDGAITGTGAGQMSRLDSSEIAAKKSADRCHGGVVASDAFFPFRDGIDQAAKAGILAAIQPGGSRNDPEVIAAANEHGMTMIFTGRRHFKH